MTERPDVKLLENEEFDDEGEKCFIYGEKGETTYKIYYKQGAYGSFSYNPMTPCGDVVGVSDGDYDYTTLEDARQDLLGMCDACSGNSSVIEDCWRPEVVEIIEQKSWVPGEESVQDREEKEEAEEDDLTPEEEAILDKSDTERYEINNQYTNRAPTPPKEISALDREISSMVFIYDDHVPKIDLAGCIHALIDNLHIISLPKDHELLYYEHGLYHPDAEIWIEKVLARAFVNMVNKEYNPIYRTNHRNHIVDRIKELTAQVSLTFDEDLSLVNMKNGIYNWQTQTLSPHTPEFLSRIQIPVTYNPSATCPSISKFLTIVFKPEDIPKVLEFVGYCLYRAYPIQKALILLGEGGTGKSTFLNILRSFVGEDHAEVIPPQELANDKFAGIALKNMLVNAPADITSEKLEQTAFIKCLVGVDKSRGQKKFQDAVAFRNYAKQIFGMNKLPVTKDRTTGWYRRIEILLMTHVLGENELSTEFITSLTSPSELSGLFNLAMDSLRTLISQKHFTNQTSIGETHALYDAASMPETTFRDRFLQNLIGSVTSKDEIYERYTTFCEKSGATPMTKNNLSVFIHKNVEWLPKPKDSNEEKGWINRRMCAIWKNTGFNAQEWVQWCIANNVDVEDI